MFHRIHGKQKFKTMENIMSKTIDLNEDFFDPFADSPVTVGVTDQSIRSHVQSVAGQAISTPAKTKIAPEFQYAQKIERDAHVAQKDGMLYCWNTNYWALQTDKQNGSHALLWLGKNTPQRANAATAESCVRTAMLLAKSLPEKSQNTIVPVHNVWFTFNDDHSISVMKPDHKIGITHRVPVQTKAQPGNYIPAALPKDSLFAKFIESSIPDREIRELLQTYVGYTLCSDVSHQTGQLWIGARGSNGKSTMLKIVMALHEKAIAMQLDKLDGFNLANLVGATLIACDETPKGKIDQQVLKSLISGGTTAIDRKFKDVISYQNKAKFIVCANHLPALSDQSDAFWRRLQVIEWNQTFTGDNIVFDLDQKIIQHELHLVLDWALAGLQTLERNGKFIVPEAVKQSAQAAKIESNNVANWIESNGVNYSDPKQPLTDKSTLFHNYKEFCQDNGFQPCASNQFFARLNNEFPQLLESRVTVGAGTNKKRVRCVNLTTGVFSSDDLKQQLAEEVREIEEAFGYQ
jgi:putative DNA primase/helicase